MATEEIEKMENRRTIRGEYMKETTKKLLEQVDKEHDWREGQTWGGRGTYLSRTDVCRVCGLQRYWEYDIQHGIDDEYTFIDENDNELTLREASTRKCL
jgi:hypothetical protein